MIKLFFVGDGPRDGAILPPIVGSLLATPIDATFQPMPRLHGASGLEKKVRFALLQALDQKAQGLVACVDRDKHGKKDKFRLLVAARDKHRQINPPFPMAFGEADPHSEAWLLDDPVAVRTGLELPADAPIDNVRKLKDPKQYLDGLCAKQAGSRSAREQLKAIAEQLTRSRCVHAKETGFDRFCDEVTRELGPLVPSS